MGRAAQQSPLLAGRRRERGIALALALFATVLVGAMVAGAFVAATEEQRQSESWRRLGRSLGAAEEGLARELLSADPQTYAALALYPADSLPVGPRVTSGGSYAGFVYRLNDRTFLLDVAGADEPAGATALGGARARIGVFAQLRAPHLDLRAALTSSGPVDLSGPVGIDGADQAPTGWQSCGPPDSMRAGLRTSGTLRADDTTGLSGAPPVWRDPGPIDTVEVPRWAGRAGWVLPGGDYAIGPAIRGADCDRTVATNWGEPQDPGSVCGSYAPVVVVTGDVTVSGGRGQGTLVVDGDLTLSGGTEFVGVVLVSGTLRSADSGSHITGAVVAGRVELANRQLGGRPMVTFSKCAIDMALRAFATLIPLRSRGWVQVF